MIESVLIANRGEIAVRIIRTCRRLGIRSIAVYSDADARAAHVAEADAAFWIGPARAADSYLNQARILDVAKTAHAGAIHPGYGFLAENADFAQACLDADLIWVGPGPAAMRAVGDKARAKALAELHAVPLLPGYYGDDQSVETLQRHADQIGYPVLIKASAGGGGRGMRVVEAADQFANALEAARREAQASFGDDRVLLERYVLRPRHVEVQIFGDQHGHLIHLGERECSVQRRHQKLIEESPSPVVHADLRARMGEAALRLVRAAGYESAGTVEFLLDEHGQFAFLEVNARLQVEHPVTEAVTGLDLVEWQLRVAAGEPLPLGQADVRFEGHAIEARVIAEDALTGFLPSSGTIDRFAYPPSVRVDTWVGGGTQVTPYYDSLLAKVIAHGPTRARARHTLANALTELRVDGIRHNVDLLLAVVEHPAFRAGDLHTGFLEAHRLVEELAEIPPPVLAAASALDFLVPRSKPDPWRHRSGWRQARIDQPATWSRAGRPHAVQVTADLGGDGVIVDTGAAQVHVRPLGGPVPLPLPLGEGGGEGVALAREHPVAEQALTRASRGLIHSQRERLKNAFRWRLSVDGHAVTVLEDGPDWRVVEWNDRGFRLARTPPLSVEEAAGERAAGGGSGRLTAPMPGRVVKIAVQAGQRVVQNQPLVVLEAMKMEHVVEAPHAGLVSELCVEVGSQVASGTQLLVLAPLAPKVE